MLRLAKLNKIHGSENDIHTYNAYYHCDLLRISQDEFDRIIGSVKALDILRIRMLSRTEIKNLTVFA